MLQIVSIMLQRRFCWSDRASVSMRRARELVIEHDDRDCVKVVGRVGCFRAKSAMKTCMKCCMWMLRLAFRSNHICITCLKSGSEHLQHLDQTPHMHGAGAPGRCRCPHGGIRSILFIVKVLRVLALAASG